MLEINQDIMIISEANMLMNLTDFEKQVIGYKMLLPLTVRNQVVARLVLLVREEFTIEKEPGVLKEIKYNKTTRILGANIQHNGLWTSHLESGPKALLPQVRKLLGMLRHLGPKIPPRCRNNLAKGLIHSRLAYLMPFWDVFHPKLFFGVETSQALCRSFVQAFCYALNTPPKGGGVS